MLLPLRFISAAKCGQDPQENQEQNKQAGIHEGIPHASDLETPL